MPRFNARAISSIQLVVKCAENARFDSGPVVNWHRRFLRGFFPFYSSFTRRWAVNSP